MEKIGEIAVEVVPVAMWNHSGTLLGYFAGIFGPNNRGDTRTLYLPALHLPNSSNPKLYSTPEEAMAAWQAGQPCPLAHNPTRYNMTIATGVQITERGLYRTTKP